MAERPPIKEILEHYDAQHVPESTRWVSMFCPFHEDRKDKSASVNCELQMFRCFVCQIESPWGTEQSHHLTVTTLWHGRRGLAISVVPSEKLKQFLGETSKEYHRQIRDPESAGSRYLVDRGFSYQTAEKLQLGYVGNPVVGHEEYAGRLCIPYLTPLGEVVGVKFRRIDFNGEEGNGPKYPGLHGEDGAPRIYNTMALVLPGTFICITEGELDAATAMQEGLPAVGLPGVSSFKPETMAPPFKGYDTVFILADSDDKGQGREFAEKVAKHIRNVRIVPMPEGEDVNSFCKKNPGKLREKLGV